MFKLLAILALRRPLMRPSVMAVLIRPCMCAVIKLDKQNESFASPLATVSRTMVDPIIDEGCQAGHNSNPVCKYLKLVWPRSPRLRYKEIKVSAWRVGIGYSIMNEGCGEMWELATEGGSRELMWWTMKCTCMGVHVTCMHVSNEAFSVRRGGEPDRLISSGNVDNENIFSEFSINCTMSLSTPQSVND